MNNHEVLETIHWITFGYVAFGYEGIGIFPKLLYIIEGSLSYIKN